MRTISKCSPKSRSLRKINEANVHLVSEETGSLARHMTGVIFTQFPSLQWNMENHAFCNDIEALRRAKKEISSTSCPIVFSALTQPRLNKSLKNWCARREIPCIELVENLTQEVAAITGHRATRDASLAHRCDDDYFRRMDAWEFTLQHDDSRRLETVGESDLILLGISRVGKTPLSAYLGSMGYRVANVSIADGIPVPDEVKANRKKTIGVTITAARLAAIRRRRFELNRFADALRSRGEIPEYYSHQAIRKEIAYAEKQFKKLRLPMLDMTDLTVEESAVRILKKLGIE